MSALIWRHYLQNGTSYNGLKINAEIIVSLQIIKKVFPSAFANGIEDVGLHPIRVAVGAKQAKKQWRIKVFRLNRIKYLCVFNKFNRNTDLILYYV